MSWRRVALLAVLLHTTFFYHGCDQQNTYFSVGPVVPYASVALEGDDHWPSRLLEASAWLFLGNVGLVLLALVWIRWRHPRLSRLAASRSFLVALALAVMLANSFLANAAVWRWTVWSPTMHVMSAVHWLLVGEDGGNSAELTRLEATIGSRVYFAALVLGPWAFLRGFWFLLRRYWLIEPRRWWQFQLGGLMAAVVILGTGIGLVVRWLMSQP